MSEESRTSRPELRDLRRSLSDEELARLPRLTEEQVREALEQGRRDYFRALQASRPSYVPTGRFYR